MITHSEETCKGTTCSLHNPSDHKMKDWPRNIRESGLVERICTHGVGHPDPDSVNWLEEHGSPWKVGYWGVHGCCGCCGDNPYGSPEVL